MAADVRYPFIESEEVTSLKTAPRLPLLLIVLTAAPLAAEVMTEVRAMLPHPAATVEPTAAPLATAEADAVPAAAMAVPEPAVAVAALPTAALAAPAVRTVTIIMIASIAPCPRLELLYLKDS